MTSLILLFYLIRLNRCSVNDMQSFYVHVYSSPCTPEDRREKTKIISTTKTCTVTFLIMRYEHNATPSFGWRIAMCYHVCVDGQLY